VAALRIGIIRVGASVFRNGFTFQLAVCLRFLDLKEQPLNLCPLFEFDELSSF
jgi:hypothetical protein